MPLGKLSKAQIAKGFEVCMNALQIDATFCKWLNVLCSQILEGLEAALKEGAPKSKLTELSSKFYTAIPHDFGRRMPPVIGNKQMLQDKFDMLLVSCTGCVINPSG